MTMTRDRIQSIGWAFVLTASFGLTAGLMLRVNAVKSEVRLTERKIVAIKQQQQFLETEFQTRSNQQQLTAINDVEFGYKAPTAAQYIEGERQLAAFASPRAPDAPAPIRMASATVDTVVDVAADAAGDARGGSFPAIVSPLTGTAMAAEPTTRLLRQPAAVEPAAVVAGPAARPAKVALNDRLARIEPIKAESE